MKLKIKKSDFPAFAVPALLFGSASTNAMASELVYVPINPTFGGNLLNERVLPNNAQATKQYKNPAPDKNSPFLQQSPLEQFNDMLQRPILSQLSSVLTPNIIGSEGKLISATVETGNSRINITHMGGGLLQTNTTGKVTGASTSFQVGQ